MTNSFTTLLFILGIAIILLVSVCTAFVYGVRIGKAMQEDIPPAPLVEPVKNAAKKAYKLIYDFKGKSFIQKKREKEDDDGWANW